MDRTGLEIPLYGGVPRPEDRSNSRLHEPSEYENVRSLCRQLNATTRNSGQCDPLSEKRKGPNHLVHKLKRNKEEKLSNKNKNKTTSCITAQRVSGWTEIPKGHESHCVKSCPPDTVCG